ncbi:MAG: penicillin-binding transpeptidase domain-containing protein [Proteobacteria bacterium]|jgi:cell division protein FtsI (penicillin-binding protein 3)|nr:penicillin-binding transpeptidase domain-containing protein [Pseudomonadota bacterium]MDA1299096.1 penicillin-binding transpeptidase domain-containing protein [Pseudomonadota bacterium]
MPLRVYLLGALILLLTVGMHVRLGYLYFIEKDFLQDQGDARTIRMERINAHRGMVRDRWGKPLAVSSPVISLWANPRKLLVDDVELAPLADQLGVPREAFVRRMTEAGNKEFVYLRRHLPPAQAQRILAMNLPGVFEEKEYHRYYPAGEVAAHAVGFTNIDDHGQEGLELSFNDWLAGSPGRKKVLKNLYGEIVRDLMPVKEAEPGRNLDLSLDMRLQYLAYRELKSAIAHLGAASGSIVLLDVATGQILAMVNQPSYNPNNRENLDLGSVRNRAVTDEFEPGSTVKPFTVAVALQSGFAPDTVIDTNPGLLRVGNFTVRDPLNRGTLDLTAIIAHSSQVGISKLALQLDEYAVWSMFQQVGFGQSTGFGFPGERAGLLPNHRRWRDIERVTFAYGYGLTVTPLQLASAYMTIATGGVHRDVSILAGSESQGSRVIPESVAMQLRQMLRAVVTDGTGTRAATDAYGVAGKTGTVRKIGENGYEDNQHLAFFAGMAPFRSPRLVGVVLINEPRSEDYGGGAIAAPVFSRVMSGALRLLRVPPDVLDGAA